MVKTSDKLDGFAPGATPICVFCNAPWTGDMMKIFADAEMYHGYYGESNVERITAVIDITCHECERLIYRKELAEVPFTGGW